MPDEAYAADLNVEVPGRPVATDRHRAAVTPIRSTAYRRLQLAVSGELPLDPLEPFEYAAGHALFEGRSDQRAHLIAWLVDHLAGRADVANRVLSVGCGDGSVDVSIAAALTARGRDVDYVGVEPHAPSGRAFAARLSGVPGTRASVLGRPFERTRPKGKFDVVLAVHSLYYVTDLAATLRRACSLLAPGGELIVLHAPLEPLNLLVRLLAPGHRQAFGDEVEAQLRAMNRIPQVVRVENRLDLTATGDADVDRRLVEFTVQAELPPALLPLVRDALAERSLLGTGLVIEHPVDAFVVPA